ncbi:MAG: hypothetical protein ACKOTZ_02035, partial [Chloroflexota bacterium]
ASKGWVIAEFLVLEKAAYTVIFGDASCAEGGGTKLARVTLPGPGYTKVLTVAVTVSPFASVRFATPVAVAPAGCVDLALYQAATSDPS